jgi:hypothetical protein
MSGGVKQGSATEAKDGGWVPGKRDQDAEAALNSRVPGAAFAGGTGHSNPYVPFVAVMVRW